jgi:hypothetical protein
MTEIRHTERLTEQRFDQPNVRRFVHLCPHGRTYAWESRLKDWSVPRSCPGCKAPLHVNGQTNGGRNDG